MNHPRVTAEAMGIARRRRTRVERPSRPRGRTNRPGTSLAELAVTMWLIAMIGAILVALLRTQSRVAGHSADRAEALDALRTAGAVLTADLAPILPSADLHGIGEDTAALRVFRGVAVVCGFTGGDPLVRYRGLRRADPAKDSVLVLTAGVERGDSLRGSSPAAGECGSSGDESVFRLRLGTALAEHDLLLIFEAGSYHLDRALRYRRGAGGRQPITAEVFAGESRFTTLAGATGELEAIEIGLSPEASARTIRGAPLAERARLRVSFRNGGGS